MAYAGHGFEFKATEVMRGHWAVTASVLNITVWTTVNIEAEDDIQALGKGIHIFADRLKQVLDDPPEYDGD